MAAFSANTGAITNGAIDSQGLVSDQVTKKSGVLSSTKTTTHYEGTDQQVVSSTLSGETVRLRSSGDTTILGSNVVGTGDVSVVAGGDLTVGALAAQDHEAQSVKVKKSGLSIGGGGVFVGVASNRNESTLDSVTHTGSLVGSASGNTTLVADGVLTVSGSQVVAPGTTTLAGESLVIEHVTDTLDATNASKSSSFGLSIGVQSPLVSGVQTAARMGEIASGTSNDRVAAVAGLAGGLAAYNAAEAMLNDPGALGGVSVSASLGFSKSKSSGESHDETAIGSLVSGRNVNLVASGAGAQSTIRVSGSDVRASGELLLSAEGAITAEAAQERDRFSGSSKSVGASVGVTVGLSATGPSGPSLNASFSSSKGRYSGEEVSNREAVLAAGGTARVVTPGTLTLDGAQLAGNRVEVAAGHLEIVSRQDTARYEASNKSVGAGVSFNPATGAVNGSLNLGSGQQQGDYASVAEQAGIYAGSGGYDIDVAGKTSLTGAVIASEADEAKNRFSTGTLELSDIANRESWSASQTNVGLGLGANVGKDGQGNSAVDPDRVPGTSLPGLAVPGLGTLSATPPAAMGASGGQNSITGSAIAPGVIEITSGDTASLAAASGVSRDTSNANAPLVREFDESKRQEIADGFDAARALGNEVGTFFANRAEEEKSLREQAAAAKVRGDTAEYDRLTGEAEALNQTFGGGSAARLLATAITGAASGDVTGSLGGLVQSAAVNVLQGLAVSEVKTIADSIEGTLGSETTRAALQALAGCAGAAAGGSGDCGSAAMGAAASAVLNYLLTSYVDPEPEIDPATGRRTARSLEDQEARKNLVASIIAGIAEGTGLDTGSASNAAQLETENNDLKKIEGLAFETRLVCTNGEPQCKNAIPFDRWDDPAGSFDNRRAYDEARAAVGSEASREQIVEVLRAAYWAEVPLVDAAEYVRRGYSWEQAADLWNENKALGPYGMNSPFNTDNWESYTIAPGDNLESIASLRPGLSTADLAWLNGVADPDALATGDTLRLPKQSYLDNLAKAPVYLSNYPSLSSQDIRISNGVHLDPRLPDPVAGLSYTPNLLNGGSVNNQMSHVSGYVAELQLANTVAALPGETVLRYGDMVGTRGADIISVNADGTVTLWDNKFRNASEYLKPSPTFSLNANGEQTSRLKNALAQAERAIMNATLPQEIEDAALKNLEQGNFITNTPASGNLKNSVHVRFCNNKPCGI